MRALLDCAFQDFTGHFEIAFANNDEGRCCERGRTAVRPTLLGRGGRDGGKGFCFVLLFVCLAAFSDAWQQPARRRDEGWKAKQEYVRAVAEVSTRETAFPQTQNLTRPIAGASGQDG